ncbi:MAG: hypothetical protein ACK551_01335 [Vampirovibrionales bacterium]
MASESSTPSDTSTNDRVEEETTKEALFRKIGMIAWAVIAVLGFINGNWVLGVSALLASFACVESREVRFKSLQKEVERLKKEGRLEEAQKKENEKNMLLPTWGNSVGVAIGSFIFFGLISLPFQSAEQTQAEEPSVTRNIETSATENKNDPYVEATDTVGFETISPIEKKLLLAWPELTCSNMKYKGDASLNYGICHFGEAFNDNEDGRWLESNSVAIHPDSRIEIELFSPTTEEDFTNEETQERLTYNFEALSSLLPALVDSNSVTTILNMVKNRYNTIVNECIFDVNNKEPDMQKLELRRFVLCNQLPPYEKKFHSRQGLDVYIVNYTGAYWLVINIEPE